MNVKAFVNELLEKCGPGSNFDGGLKQAFDAGIDLSCVFEYLLINKLGGFSLNRDATSLEYSGIPGAILKREGLRTERGRRSYDNAMEIQMMVNYGTG